MKKSKIIIPALAMLVMSTAATVTGTVAWFSANKVVSAEGMLVKAQAEGSLVITAGTHKPTITDHGSKHIFNDASAQALNPSTHVNTSGRTGEAWGTGLVYVTNGEDVNPETGSYKANPSTGNDLEYSSASGSMYYKDYVVYVAGDGNTFNNQKLIVTLEGTIKPKDSNETAQNAAAKEINKAISVDFYCKNSDVENWTTTNAMIEESYFMGTLNLAHRRNTSNKTSELISSNYKLEYTQNNATQGMTINGTQESQCLAITMRVYFDGNLIEIAGGESGTAGTAYTDAYGAAVEKTDATFSTEHPDYVYKDGTYVSWDNAPAKLAGYTAVDGTKSTYRYARTVDTADIRDVALSVNFSLESIPQNNGD